MLGCGCCGGNPGDPVPGGCAVCNLIWDDGYLADVTPYEDNFSNVNPGWQFLDHWPLQNDPQPPNLITDYHRSNRLHWSKTPFFRWFERFVYLQTRAVPPQPLPDTSQGRLPWLNVRRYVNLYFPDSPNLRKYRFEVSVNYPRDTLPMVNLFGYGPANGVTGVFGIGYTNFHVFATGLSSGVDEHPNAQLAVGIHLKSEVSGSWTQPEFEKTVFVPFGNVNLRLEYTVNPATGTTITSYYVNDVLEREVPLDFFRSNPLGTWTATPSCWSYCGEIIRLAAFEPWRNNPWNQAPPAVWYWNGFVWLRYTGNTTGPDGMLFGVHWSVPNIPSEKLYFDDYAMSIVAP